MKNNLFTGVCTALVTPFLDGSVNYPLAEVLLHRQIDAGVNAVVLSGTTGESPTLTNQEKLQLFRRCKESAADSCTIIAGTGSNSTAHTIELSVAAEAVGVDALLIVSPYYNKGTPDGLVSHYRAVASAVRIPIIIYNVPSRTGMDIPISVYQRLSDIPNISGVKEASHDITKVTKIRQACGPDFQIWAGNDDMIVPVISLGGQGVISAVSNVCPDETVAMTEAALAGNFNTAAALQCQMAELIDLLFCEVNPVAVKAAMKLIGYDCGNCRLPLSPLRTENLKRLERLLT